ncbi:MAG: peptidase domain-containing ABC transporter [Roseiarcus sp.]
MEPGLEAVVEAQGGVEPSGLACLVIVARHHGLHLSAAQLTRDNVLTGREVSVPELLKCGRAAGLKVSALRLTWDRLGRLKKTLPAIVTLKNGAGMVLRRVDGEGDQARVVLQDPNAGDDAPLLLDRARFEEVWAGGVVLAKRNYEIADETQPFSIGLVTALLFRERWIVRDVAICAVVLSILALAPIVFWRLLSDKVIYYKAYNTLFVVCLAMGVLVIFEAVFAYLRQLLILHLTTRVDVKLATYMFDKILNLPIDFFERTQVGRITYDAQQIWRIRTFLTGQLFGTVLDSTTMLVFLPVMFFFSPIMTAIVLGTCALIVLWIVAMLPYYRLKTNAVESAESARGAFLVQTIHGIRTVKSLALDARQRHLWDVHTARVAKLRFAEGMTGNILQCVVRPFERFAVSGSFAVGVYLALASDDPVYVGALFAFLLLSQRVSAPLLQMAKLVNQYDEARLAVAVVGQLVNQPPEQGRTGHGVRTPLEGHVRFSNVTFRYQGASEPALRDVTFEAACGTTLGIMGRSGSGKTTVTRLLQRLHSNYEGLIKIDGIDVREYDVDHLRRSLGVVLQDNFLFSGTIRENIMAAKSDASFDQVVRAARLAGAEEFIDKLPRGYDTPIYEGSPNLSGGQRQRLAIARALIVDPRVLILDEATSALDAESEAIVNANIARIAHGRTMIIISHRLAALVTADTILVLEQGRVHDFGRHEELLERCDLYSNLWHQQTQHVLGMAPRNARASYGGPRRVG